MSLFFQLLLVSENLKLSQAWRPPQDALCFNCRSDSDPSSLLRMTRRAMTADYGVTTGDNPAAFRFAFSAVSPAPFKAFHRRNTSTDCARARVTPST